MISPGLPVGGAPAGGLTVLFPSAALPLSDGLAGTAGGTAESPCPRLPAGGTLPTGGISAAGWTSGALLPF
jgi:hypothetical protein